MIIFYNISCRVLASVDNIAAVAAAGADTFVAGSAIFGKPNYKTVITEMRGQLAQLG